MSKLVNSLIRRNISANYQLEDDLMNKDNENEYKIFDKMEISILWRKKFINKLLAILFLKYQIQLKQGKVSA